MSVPLLDLEAQYTPLRDQLLAAVTRVCDSQRFIMGPEIEGLERELCALLGIKHAIAVSSGTDALLLALMALDIKAGDEVVTTTFSFFATAGAIVRVGAKPDVSVTIELGANVVAQVPPVTPAVIVQLIPAGLLVTRPLPVPPPVTVMPCVWNVASAVRPCDMIS